MSKYTSQTVPGEHKITFHHPMLHKHLTIKPIGLRPMDVGVSTSQPEYPRAARKLARMLTGKRPTIKAKARA